MAKLKLLKYELDTNLLINRNTPPDFRLPKYIALVYAWLGGVRQILSDFLAYRSEIREYLKYNNQIMILEEMLNDYYDPTLRRIQLTSQPFYVGYPVGVSGVEIEAYVGTAISAGDIESPANPAYIGYPNEAGADGTIFLPQVLGDDDFAKKVLAHVLDYAFFGVKITVVRI